MGIDQIIWRLRVRNVRAGTVAKSTQVELVISTEGRPVWTGMAHWRHQNQGLLIGYGEMDLGASKRVRRLVDVIHQRRDGNLAVRESDEGQWFAFPSGERLLIEANAFANNARDCETRWTFDVETGLVRQPKKSGRSRGRGTRG